MGLRKSKIFKQRLDRPVFKHDCDECEFIEGFILKDRRYDLYRCGQGVCGPSYIARYSEGAGYWSMLWSVLKGVTADKLGLTSLLYEVQKRAKIEELKIEAGDLL